MHAERIRVEEEERVLLEVKIMRRRGHLLLLRK